MLDIFGHFCYNPMLPHYVSGKSLLQDKNEPEAKDHKEVQNNVSKLQLRDHDGFLSR
jgi:hypothetical protein